MPMVIFGDDNITHSYTNGPIFPRFDGPNKSKLILNVFKCIKLSYQFTKKEFSYEFHTGSPIGILFLVGVLR
ncbi:hypothetical protein Hanom_Chr12g01172481 [Helianthus anomalus]